MELVKIKDVFISIKNGASIQQDKLSGGIPITRIESISNNIIDLEKLGYAGIINESFEKFYLQDGDILMSHINSVSHLGKAAIYEKRNEKIIHGMNLLCLKADKKVLFPKYAFYFFTTTQFRDSIKKITKKSVNQASFNITSFYDIEIPVLLLLDQIHIANILGKAEKLIAQRKESLRLLDAFLKSTFLEMFCTNKEIESWHETSFGKLVEQKKVSMRSGPFGSSLLHGEFSETGDIKVLGIDNVVNNRFEWKRNRCITLEKFQELKRYQVFPNDVLISIMATVGRTAVVPENIPISINSKHLAAITLDKETLNPYFVSFAFQTHPTILKQMKNSMKGAIMDGLNLTIIKSIKFKHPPIHLQNQFASIVSKTETLKKQYTASLRELENLFGVLSQKAFKGELNKAEQIVSTYALKEMSLSIAAEPTVVFEKTVSTIPPAKKGFAKQVLGGKIVSLFKNDKYFTHIKFQKLQYLAEQIAEEDLLWNYYRQSAGPYDNKFMHTVSNKLKQNKWFEENNYKFYPLPKANDVDKYYSGYFGNKEEKLNKLFSLLENATEKFCEAVAAVYAVWNNHIILKKPFDATEIKKEFFEWSSRKGEIFTENEFDKTLPWMQNQKIIPTGFGQLIKEKLK